MSMFKKTLTRPDGRLLYLYSTRPIQDAITAPSPAYKGDKTRPHQRWHPLRREWVIYAAHGQNHAFSTEMPPGDYEVAVFEDPFPLLSLTTDEAPEMIVPTQPSKGVCEVIVFSRDPEMSLGNLPRKRIQLVLEVLGERTRELGKNELVQYVLPLENKGAEMGVTLHHPHGQIYSYSFIPPVQDRFLESMKKHWNENGTGLMEKIILDEQEDGRRIIMDTENIVCFVPAFARYPYETWIVPKRRTGFLHEMTNEELFDLSAVIKALMLKYDHLWARPLPYLMTINQAPAKGDHPYAHFFFQITPRCRTKDKLKFLGGSEIGAGVFVNDSLPEEKAQEIRDVEVLVEEEDER